MPSHRVFHRYVVQVEILTDYELDEIVLSLEEIVGDDDHSVGGWKIEHERLTGPRVAKILTAHGNGPEFFELTEDGEDEYADA